MMTKKMTGRTKMSKGLDELFERQGEIQREMFKQGMYAGFVSDSVSDDIVISGLPVDLPTLSSYHIQHLISEIGEVLDADKRWKNFRADKYDKDAKLEELADCFIVLMNICMYSDINAGELELAIIDKLETVKNRVEHYNDKNESVIVCHDGGFDI